MGRVKPPPIVLSISGSDPGGGAGIEADLKTFHRHGVHGLALPTLLTAQSTLGVKKVCFLDPDFLAEQWRVLFADLRPDTIKIGALGSKSMVRRVARLLSSPEAQGIPVVLDPVMGSTSGAALLEANALPFLIHRLFPLCRIVTPNALEFSAWMGKNIHAVGAATDLRNFGRDKPYAILLKGGHFDERESVDLLWNQDRLKRFRSPRLSGNAHGTGCVLASSIAANLALGLSVTTACRRGKAFVHKALSASIPIGRGSRLLNLWI